MTPDITVVFTPEHTKVRILRRMASTLAAPANETLAQTLADELHALIADVLGVYGARPPRAQHQDPQDATTAAIEEAELVDGILRTAVGLLPKDEEAATSDVCWVDEQLISLDVDLYERLAHIRDAIEGTTILDDAEEAVAEFERQQSGGLQ
jgi:hypothetical protein